MLYHIAVDIGASNGRLVLGTFENGCIELKEIYRFENMIVEKNGNCLWNTDKLLEEIITGLQAVKSAGIKECTVGFDTWAVDYVLLDKDGNRLQKVYSYRDDRTRTAIRDFQKYKSLADIYNTTGIQFLNFNTLFQLFVHNKEEMEKAYKILLIPDYLYYFFSGKHISEITNASTTQLLNLETKDYDKELLKLLNVRRDQFAELTEPGTTIGPILETLREQYNLPRCEMVCVATHDTASSVLGVPATLKNFAYLSSGTWSLMGVENTLPVTNELSFRGNYTNERGAYGTYRFLKNIMGLWLIQEASRVFGGRFSYGEFVRMAKDIPPFQFSINCNHERFFKPENMITEIQNFCRETGQPVPATPGELARCIFDSLALMYGRTMREIAGISGIPVSSLHIVGGGSQNELLCQLTADTARVSVATGPVESTAIGNIAVQMISSGELKNIMEARQIIMQSFDTKLYYPDKDIDLSEVYERFNRHVMGDDN